VSEPTVKLDIEHVLVQDDPRMWSATRKVRFEGRPLYHTDH